MSTTKQAIAALAAFAALALLATSQPAAAHDDEDGDDGNARHYVASYIPPLGARAIYQVWIAASNPQSEAASISIKAYLNKNSTAQTCSPITLEPYEIRRIWRNGPNGDFCVTDAETETTPYSLRIETVKGVHLSGYYVVNPARGWNLVPMVITRVAATTPPQTTPPPTTPPPPPCPNPADLASCPPAPPGGGS